MPVLSCAYLVCIVRMLVCAGAFVCVRVCAVTIVSRDKILRFTNTLIINFRGQQARKQQLNDDKCECTFPVTVGVC